MVLAVMARLFFFFVAEEAAVFGGVALGECDLLRVVTVLTFLFRLFFVHWVVFRVGGVMGQLHRRFRRCIPEEKKNAPADHEEEGGVEKGFFVGIVSLHLD